MKRLLCSTIVAISALMSGLVTGTASSTTIDVYLIGGQSNAAGRAFTAKVSSDPAGIGSNASMLSNSDVRFYYSSTVGANSGATPNTWTTLEPAAQFSGYFGPELGLGNQLAALNPTRDIALIKHAKGATSLHSDWDSSGSGGTQWNLFTQTVHAGLQALIDDGYTPVVRGMVWQQGETDANSATNAPSYGANLRQLVLDTRAEFSAPDMAFLYGTILQKENRTYGDVVREGQEAVDEGSGDLLATVGATLIDADDLDTNFNSDNIHFDYVSQLELGTRFANEFGVIAVVPEPGSLVILGSVGVLLLRRRYSAS